MRSEFLTGLTELANKDDRVVLLTADLGFGSIEVFADTHPKRFFNVGVAEQAMIGIATGLAESGFIPYCYSIASFSVGRTFEFLRNGPIFHRLPVRLIGVGPGFDYSFDGLTHFALEDLTLLQTQPNTEVIAPRNGDSARHHAEQGSTHPGLIYYRLARASYEIPLEILIPRVYSFCSVLAFGDSLNVAMLISQQIQATSGIRVPVFSVEKVSLEAYKNLALEIQQSNCKVLVLTENHYVKGGFGSLLSDSLMEIGWQGRILKWGVEKAPFFELGDSEYMISRYCVSADEICRKAIGIIGEKHAQ